MSLFLASLNVLNIMKTAILVFVIFVDALNEADLSAAW